MSRIPRTPGVRGLLEPRTQGVARFVRSPPANFLAPLRGADGSPITSGCKVKLVTTKTNSENAYRLNQNPLKWVTTASLLE